MKKIKKLKKEMVFPIIGLDISLQDTGLVMLLSGKTPESILSCSITSDPKTPEFRRVCGIVDRVISEIISSGFNYATTKVAFIEGHAFGRNTGKAKTRAELAGIIKYRLVGAGISTFIVPPNSLKMVTAGNGHATKKDMINAVKDRFGVIYTNDNLADAHALAEYGKEVLLGGKRYEYECLYLDDLLRQNIKL